MATNTELRGAFSTSSTASNIFHPPSSQAEIKDILQQLHSHKEAWLRTTIHQRIAFLDHIMQDLLNVAPQWVAASVAAKARNHKEQSSVEKEEWSTGIWVNIRHLKQLRKSLLDIESYGYPRVPGPIKKLANGQIRTQVFPASALDRLIFNGYQAEIWMEPGVTAEHLKQTQAVHYHQEEQKGKIALVLGAGNVSSIGFTDILYKLFVENQVVLFKANPVNAYLGPFLALAFQSLITEGYLGVVYGGAVEGDYLCQYPFIDEIHVTGSDTTYEAILYGSGDDGRVRKASNQPRFEKRVTGELGNVSPLIIIPGPWSQSNLTYQAKQIVASLATNAGFNCNATRVIIQHKEWLQRQELIREIHHLLARLPLRTAYYPDAQQRHQSFLQAHPDADTFGTPTADNQLPWTLIADLPSDHGDEICFSTEAFCGLFAETALSAGSIADYIDQAVIFANETLWGTLNATILVHPATLKDPMVAEALERAITNLRYGTISINSWAGLSYLLGTTTWGAFPGHLPTDIQSGTGVVHNTFMFDKPQKSLLRAPFHKTLFSAGAMIDEKMSPRLIEQIVRFEAMPSIRQFLKVVQAILP